MKKVVFPVVVSSIIFLASYADAGNLGIGLHGGYGIIKFEEKADFLGTDFESKSKRDAILLGVSGEYSFERPANFYAGITIDWAFGLRDRETWRQDNVQVQTNNMSFFGQFYDFRFGYKDIFNNFHYRFYVSGGWDGLRFKRDDFILRGVSVTGSIIEDISLLRTGGGTGVGYKLGKWALDGRLAYAYYPVGKVDNSSLSQFTFETNGTCLDMGFGVTREITKNMNLYFGGSYTILKLDQSDIMRSGSIQAVYPESKTEIINGGASLTFAF